MRPPEFYEDLPLVDYRKEMEQMSDRDLLRSIFVQMNYIYYHSPETLWGSSAGHKTSRGEVLIRVREALLDKGYDGNALSAAMSLAIS